MADNGDVIDSLLVRLGLDTDEKDFQETSSLFSGVRTAALQFGAAIGAGLGLRELTFGFASAKDELGKFSDVFGVSAQFVDSLGFALDRSGGRAEDAFGSIERMRDLLESTEWGEIPSDAFRVAGFDPMLLQGVTSVAEAYERLSAATDNLSPENARRALSSLGFGQAEITLFRGRGADSFASLMAEGQAYARVTRETTAQAAKFQDALTNLTKATEGLTNEISPLITEGTAEAMQSVAEHIRDNRNEMAGLLKEAMPWLEATAVGVGALVALEGGRSLLGKLAPFAAKGGAVGAIALGYQFLQENPNYIDQAKAATEASWRYNAGRLGRVLGSDWLKNQAMQPELFTGESGEGDEIPGVSEIPGGVPAPQTPTTVSQGDTIIHVDARGATDPAATEDAARRGAEEALNRAARNTITDLQTPVK